MPTIIRFTGYVVIGSLGFLLAFLIIARCMASDLVSVPRAYIDVEPVWYDYHADGAEGVRRWTGTGEIFVSFHVDTIREIEEGNRVIVNVGSPPVGRVQLDFKNADHPLNIQSLGDFVFAECWVGDISRDSILLLKDCELASLSR